jgi:putative peptide zinc metalloprotease protein
VSRFPKLRDDLAIRKVAEGDDVAYTVCDSHRDKYYRIDPFTHLVAVHLNGERPIAEVSRLCQEQMPFTDFSIPVVEEAVQDLNAIGLLEDPYTKNLLLIERARDRTPRITDFFQNMLLWRIGVWDPDPFLTRTVGRVGWMFRPWLALVATLGLLFTTFLVFINRNHLEFDLARLLVGKQGGVAGLMTFIVILLVVGIVHEFGHAYSCKHFGGAVNRMGFMLMYFSPCFFVDVSQSMLFENRWERIWVAMGGIFFESFITIAAGIIWWITPPDLLINDIAYRTLIFGLIVGVVLNLNPLLKFDGYFVLSDLLQISELRERSGAYVSNLLKRPFRRGEQKPEAVLGLRRRRAYLTYGIVTLLYSYFVIVTFFDWLRVTLVGAFGDVGFLAFACLAGAFVRRPVMRAFERAREFGRRPARTAVPWVLAVLLLAVIAGFVRTPGYVSVRARIVSSDREAVRAEQPGRVTAVLAHEGERVVPGQVVAILENDSVAAAWDGARARSRASDLDLAQAIESRNPALYEDAMARRGAARVEESGLGQEWTRLALASRDGGVVVSPRPNERIGARLDPGDTVLIVASDRSIRMECTVKEHDIGDIDPGQRVSIRMRQDPGRTLAANVERVLPLAPQEPGALTPRFLVWCRLENPPPGLRLGETGTARIYVGRWNVYERFARFWARFVRADFWL